VGSPLAGRYCLPLPCGASLSVRHREGQILSTDPALGLNVQQHIIRAARCRAAQTAQQTKTMQTVTVKYGVESFTKNYESTPTFGQLASDASIKAVLGFGDNVRTLLDGVEQPFANLVPNGATVRIETRANSKAGLITIKMGGSTIERNVEEGHTAGEVLDFINVTDLDEGLSDPVCKVGGVIVDDDFIIASGAVVEVVEAPVEKTATLKYGCEEHDHTLSCGETFGQLAANSSLKSILGYGDNVRMLVGGVEQPSTNVVPAGEVVRIETRANAKA